MNRQPLDSLPWTLRAVGDQSEAPAQVRDRSFEAWVPSCVHTVLMKHGAIDDPYLGEGEALTRWIGLTDWEYRLTFDADGQLFDHERIDLACDGLDTVATVRLNDTVIGRGENMHVRHRFDARGALRRGRNELAITLASPVRYALAHEKQLGKLPFMSASLDRLPYNFIRKMACNFGWDWGPQLVTSGIWKGVRLEAWSKARVSRIVPAVRVNSSGRAHVAVRVILECTNAAGVELDCSWVDAALSRPPRQRAASTSNDFELHVDQPDLWWPTGHGRQSTYGIDVDLFDERGDAIDGATRTIGLRTVELDTSPDDIGRRFVVKVNGKPIFCRGFNWIPDDCFLDRANDPVRLRRRIKQAVDCGANMLRVWGGGIYETDEFYDICDEMGVLVWQDFPFACAAYPEEEPFRSLVEAEARDNVARLAHHPSLVLWNGNNENLWGYHDWGWKKDKLVEGRTWGPGYYFDLLPKVVTELDPSRPYWAASPWSGDPDIDNGLHPNLETHGNKHAWEVWHGPGDFVNYRRFTPRFCSEFGFQGPPTFATLARVMPPEQRRRDSRQMELRQKSPGGNDRNDRIAQMYFDLPAEFDDYLFILQVMQARALLCGVEWFRSRAPVCMGTLIWQLNDCWPVVSWSAIDGDGREKPMWYAARRFYADRLLTIQPSSSLSPRERAAVRGQPSSSLSLRERAGVRGPSHGDETALALFAHNDSDAHWIDTAYLRRLRFDGAVLAETTAPISVEPRSNRMILPIPPDIATPGDPAVELLVCDTPKQRASWYFAPDRQLRYHPPEFRADLSRQDNVYSLRVRARSFLRDLCIFADRLDPEARVSDQFMTLLPGESTTLEIESSHCLTLDQLVSPPVLNCANRFGRR